MRDLLLRLLLAILGSALLWAHPLAAQGPSLPEAAARLRLEAPEAVGTMPVPDLRFRPDSSDAGSDGTLIGLLIGAGVGFVAGWATYDVFCEAVDNQCSDSRLGLVLLGTGVGGGLGALVGSAVD